MHNTAFAIACIGGIIVLRVSCVSSAACKAEQADLSFVRSWRDAASSTACRGCMTPGLEVHNSINLLLDFQTTPVALAQVFHARTSTSSISEFVTAMIERMDARTLHESLGRTPSTGYPLEGVYHLEAVRAATPVLPINATGGKAMLSTFVGQVRLLTASMTNFCS